jgi:hypothetical protein
MAGLYLLPRDFYQGASYSDTVLVKDQDGNDLDLSSGYTALFQIREAVADSGASVLHELTDLDAELSLDDGSFTIEISAEESETIVSATEKAYLLAELDLEETATGEVTSFRWRLKLEREVARAEGS